MTTNIDWTDPINSTRIGNPNPAFPNSIAMCMSRTTSPPKVAPKKKKKAKVVDYKNWKEWDTPGDGTINGVVQSAGIIKASPMKSLKRKVVIKKWFKGRHFYAKKGSQDIVVDGEQKWNTYEGAKAAVESIGLEVKIT